MRLKILVLNRKREAYKILKTNLTALSGGEKLAKNHAMACQLHSTNAFLFNDFGTPFESVIDYDS
jgi:hypothetical protein